MPVNDIKKFNALSNAHHVGIIMDGNRRWAKSKGLKKIEGHKQGARAAKNIVKAAIANNITHLTLFAFSSENWKRGSSEVDDLIGLLRFFFKKEINNLIKSGIKIKILGELSLFPEDIINLLNKSVTISKNNNKLNLIIAINYGSRQEITYAVKKIVKEALLKKININDINEDTITNFLYTEGLPEPDLIIRTGGDCRLSNFLLWQSAYSELLFIKKAWPDFTKDDFFQAVNEFNNRERRYGGC
ncbi:MAG: di-trans,poly-cis-decaprenylcistransferase [Gammaproteobacteria bacterium]|nr:di-trans,poly-cis-decaprenylcistransferase [Gammaproteobacteria bacterium]